MPYPDLLNRLNLNYRRLKPAGSLGHPFFCHNSSPT
jgi:hypothetical protein